MALWTRASSRPFCAVVERRSFSQAAERLGVTQPAVSLQIQALEKRLGTQLLDRSGRRVEPTEAGMRLYRGAQRLLALEEQVRRRGRRGRRRRARAGRFEIGASTGPAGSCSSHLLCEFQARSTRELHVVLSVFDTGTIVERVAARELELGVVGAARRHRGVVFEPFFRDEVILACPPGHPFAGRTVTLDELRGAGPDRDAGGRGRPAADRGRAAAARARASATSTSGSSSACRSRSRARSAAATA